MIWFAPSVLTTIGLEHEAMPLIASEQLKLTVTSLLFQPFAFGVPDERVGDLEIVDRDGRRRQAFERVGDAVQERSEIGLFHRGIGRERRETGGMARAE